MKFTDMFKPKQKKRSNVGYVVNSQFSELFSDGYSKLSDNPEVRMAVDRIADLVSSMTIQLMQNTEKGDIRVKNDISRVVDIKPNNYMTRKNFIHWVTRVMLLEGGGNAVVKPIIFGGKLQSLQPIPPANVSFNVENYSYKINIDNVPHDPSTILHFAVNPSVENPFLGSSYQIALKDVVDNLKQAQATKKAFMKSEYMPSVIVSVDTDSEELSNEAGREKIEETYLKRKEKGKPWIIPEGLMNVQTLKPLTLNDLAINDAVTIDKRTVAGLLGVPAFLLGVGEYNKDEYNSFINTKIMAIAQVIEQTLNGLLIDNSCYFHLNARSLYNYSMLEMVQASDILMSKNALRRNEARNWIGLPPDSEMDDLLVLENYIQQSDVSKQKKLIQDTTKGGE